MADEEDRRSIFVFTDGLYTQDVRGVPDMATKETTASKAFGPQNGVYTYVPEAMALRIALNHYIDYIQINKPPTNKTVEIFGDSQAALQSFNNQLTPRPGQYIGIHLQSLLGFFTPQHKIKLFWTPGHEVVELNEKAGEEAGIATEKEAERFMIPFSLESTRQHVREF